MAKRSVSLSLFFLASMAVTQLCMAHSGSFPDYYEYDNSDEGPQARVSAKQVLKGQGERLPLAECSDGLANDYPCEHIDLHAIVTPAQLSPNAELLNDVWGWTDIATGREIAIVGTRASTVFVDITDSTAPVILGRLPSHNSGNDDWRDIKVYLDHAFIVADGRGNARHGMQVYDLTNLGSVTPGETLSATAHFDEFGSAHNIAINEDSGFAYVIGSDVCGQGLYIVDISTPIEPTFAGCYSGDGYTHDAQCVIYQGPDTRYFGSEICIAYNEDTVTIVDVTDKDVPVLLSRTPYSGASYTHQGWFLDDTHTHIIVNDELDEISIPSEVKTRSYLFDLTTLDDPQFLGSYAGPTTAIDHNLYTKDSLVYESNYRAGLRVLKADGIANGELSEVAYFDTVPCSNSAQFSGLWSSYIYFDSGNVVASDIGAGLFVLRPDEAAISNETQVAAAKVSPVCSQVNTPAPRKRGGGTLSIWALVCLFALFCFFLHRRIIH